MIVVSCVFWVALLWCWIFILSGFWFLCFAWWTLLFDRLWLCWLGFVFEVILVWIVCLFVAFLFWVGDCLWFWVFLLCYELFVGDLNVDGCYIVWLCLVTASGVFVAVLFCGLLLVTDWFSNCWDLSICMFYLWVFNL